MGSFTTLGLDIGSASCRAFLLSGKPELPDFYNSSEFVSFEIPYNQQGIKSLEALEFDLAILEPTGGYERVIQFHLNRLNKAWKRVKPYRAIALRSELGLAKSDHFDSFLLAYYGQRYYGDPQAWLLEPKLDWRSRLMRREQFQRQRRGLVNRLKHSLASEFPESPCYFSRPWGERSPGALLWLSGEQSAYYWRHDRRLESSIGTGVTEFSRALARQIAEIDRECLEIESDLTRDLQGDKERYHRVFQRFDFSLQLQCWLLARIYPFDQFLVDGQPVIHRRLSRERHKPVKYEASLATFKGLLGAGTIPSTSGIRGERSTKYLRGRKPTERTYAVCGDRQCRTAFYMWAFNRIATGKLSGDPEIRNRILTYWQRKRESQNHYRATGNLYGYTLKLLFRELCKEFCLQDLTT